MWLYGISAQRATRIALGDLLDTAIKGKVLTMDDYALRLRTIDLTWQSAQRFQLVEKWIFDAPDRKLAQALGAYGKESPNDNYQPSKRDDGTQVTWTFVDAAIDAVCEVGRDHPY